MSSNILAFPCLVPVDPNPVIFASEARERGLHTLILEMQYQDMTIEEPVARVVQCTYSKTATNEKGDRGIIALQEGIFTLSYDDRASGIYTIVPTIPGFALQHLAGTPENHREQVLAAFLYENHEEFVNNYKQPRFKVIIKTRYNGWQHLELSERALADISKGVRGYANAPLDEHFWRAMIALYDPTPSPEGPVLLK